MRYVVYVVAVLVAASIVVFLTRSEQSEIASSGPATAEVASDVELSQAETAIVPEIVGEKKQLVMHVPNMHCPFACYPAVKKTLAKQDGVAEVELAEQKDENAIDNPRVVVTVGENFNADAALQALTAAGFDESNVEAEKS